MTSSEIAANIGTLLLSVFTLWCGFQIGRFLSRRP